MGMAFPIHRILYHRHLYTNHISKSFHRSAIGSIDRYQRHVRNYSGPPGQLNPQTEEEEKQDQTANSKSSRMSSCVAAGYKVLDSITTTCAYVVVLGLAGYGYHRYYKYLVLQKMENAFAPGDPVLELAEHSTESLVFNHKEQSKIDAIVNGSLQGHYWLVIGEKGTGKSNLILSAMRKVDGDGVSLFEAHADLEIFRVRLGKALDFEFHEDSIGALFSIRGPRDATALLDIERAFNKLEKVALKRRKAIGKPLLLIINSVHLLRNDEDGIDLLELIQQRAEQWAASNLVTVIMISDDFWIYERLKNLAVRMEILPVLDLSKKEAVSVLKAHRSRAFTEDFRTSTSILEQVYDKVGGRLTFLNRVAKSHDMLRECNAICEQEKKWLLNQCWILGEEMDDDVMDQQKYCSAAMVLAKALVNLESSTSSDPKKSGNGKKSYDTADLDSITSITPFHPTPLPEIPLHQARQIMTRADFIQSYDHINIFTIDSRAMVRADSVPMMNAFREVCNIPGFDEHLQKTLDRISAIESLGRTREIVAKDLVGGGKYRVGMKDGKAWVDIEEKSNRDDCVIM